MSLPTWGRIALLLGLVGYMQLGSFRKMVLHRPDPPWAKAWEMYHGKGREQCAVDVFFIDPEGASPPEELHDWWTPIGKTRASAPHVTSNGDKDQLARKLCKALPDRAIAIVRRCGRTGGWKRTRGSLEVDQCDVRSRFEHRRKEVLQGLEATESEGAP